VALVETSATRQEGVDRLAARVRGKAAAFCGHSGVGKTSLLRRLLGDEAYGRVGAISTASGKGKHTTTGAILLPAEGGSTWIDTPGITNFGLVDVTRLDLLSHFPELARAAAGCGAGCLHEVEPSCALRGLPRRESYRQILGALQG
ncbi:MAG: GTPase RsgA, partial [Elusimicrobiota bacterium]